MKARSRKSQKDVAYEYLRKELLNNSFGSGRFITAAEIGERLRISRTPVREAFLVLESENFLKLIPKKGAFIPPTSMREMRETIESQLVIEHYSAEKLIANEDEKTFGLLGDLLKEQRDLSTRNEPDRFGQSSRHFHNAIVSGADNLILMRFHEALQDRRLRMARMAIAQVPGRMKQIAEEHKTILDSLLLGDGETVRRAMETHLYRTLAALESVER